MRTWAGRFVLVLMLLVFAIVMTMLHRQLTALQQQKEQQQTQPAR